MKRLSCSPVRALPPPSSHEYWNPPRTSTSTSRGPAMPPRPRSVRSIALTVALLAGLLTIAGVVTQVVTTQTASADTTLCDQFASMPIQNGRYIVQNNRWGSSATQCIDVTGAGFSVTQQDGTKATNGAPNSYPSIYYGCHYGNCSSGTTLPLQASTSAFAAITTSVTMTYPSAGTWDASYVRTSATSSARFPVATFFNDAVHRGFAQTSWFLTSIQAGFEPWQGGVGLAVNAFTVTTTASSPAAPITTSATSATGNSPASPTSPATTASTSIPTFA